MGKLSLKQQGIRLGQWQVVVQRRGGAGGVLGNVVKDVLVGGWMDG